MSYNSKYKGSEVEELLESIGNKVDKVDGKQLSTEDFTTLLKQKLEGLSNYDDTSIQESVSKLRADLDTLVSGNTATAIESFNEIIAFLDGIDDSESLDSVIASIEQQIAAKYTKPSTGISKNDLASDVQTSLDKANTALQEHQDISGKQDTLISGTNIKTINGESILGEGDITVENSTATAYPVVNHGANDTTFTLTPNTLHVWGMIDSLDLSLGEEVEGVVNEYFFQFESKRYTSLLLPDNLLWHAEPIINIWNTYQVSIVNGLAVISEFEKPRFVFRVLFDDSWHEYNCAEGITWDEWIRSEYNVDGFYYSQGSIVTANGSDIATNDSEPVRDYNIIEPVDYITL